MGRKKKSRIPTTWKKIVWEIPTTRNATTIGTTKSAIGKVGVQDYIYFIVSTIVCKHDGRTYLVESDCRICMDNDVSGRKDVCSTLLANGCIV